MQATDTKTVTLPQPGRYVRATQLAEMLGLSRSTIWRYASQGKFPKPIKLTENATVWDMREVEAWVEARRAAQGGDAQ